MPGRPASSLFFVCAVGALTTGASLVLTILTGVSLPVLLGILFAAIAALASYTAFRSPPHVRRSLLSRVRSGLIAGAVSTLTYDLTRYDLVKFLGFSFNPFEALPHFGRLLVGGNASLSQVWATGTAYHAANGVGFAVAYSILLAHKGIGAGILWSLFLELCTLTLYPGWLRMTLNHEFVSVSLLGHIAYGTMLGWLSRNLVTHGEMRA